MALKNGFGIVTHPHDRRIINNHLTCMTPLRCYLQGAGDFHEQPDAAYLVIGKSGCS